MTNDPDPQPLTEDELAELKVQGPRKYPQSVAARALATVEARDEEYAKGYRHGAAEAGADATSARAAELEVALRRLLHHFTERPNAHPGKPTYRSSDVSPRYIDHARRALSDEQEEQVYGKSIIEALEENPDA